MRSRSQRSISKRRQGWRCRIPRPVPARARAPRPVSQRELVTLSLLLRPEQD